MAKPNPFGDGPGSIGPQAGKPKPAGKGLGIGSIPGEVGKMLSFPFIHPVQFGGGLVHEASKAKHLPSALGAIGSQGAAKLSGRYGRMSDREAEAFAKRNLRKMEEGIPFFGGQLATYSGAVSPGQTGVQHRQYLREHPAIPAIDLVTTFAPALKGTKLAPLATPVASARRAATRAVVARAPGFAAKVDQIAAPVFAKLPNKRGAAAYHELATAERTAQREVLKAEGPYAAALKDLLPKERKELLGALNTGKRPEALKLAEAFDAYTERKGTLTDEALVRRVPAEYHTKLRDEVAAKRLSGLRRAIGPDASRAMVDAFRAGADNPHPEHGKAWNDLRRTYGDAIKREDAKHRLDRDPELGEVYTPEQAQNLSRARRRVEQGRMAPETYEALVDKMVPARFRQTEQWGAMEAARVALRERRRTEPGFGQGAYRKALKAVEDDLGFQTWRDLRDMGVNPRHVHRRALLEGEDMRLTGQRVTGAKPSVLKPSMKLADQYADDPVIMLGNEELQLVKQQVFSRAVGRIHELTGGTTWDEAVEAAKAEGWGAQAARHVRTAYRNVDSAGKIGDAAPGKALIPRAVAESMGEYLKTFKEPGMFDRLMHLWTVPILWMSPSFHINNIIGGAVLTSAQAGPTAILRHAREAMRMVREGTIDTRIPVGAVSMPAYRKVFNAAQSEAQGAGLANLLIRSGHKAVDVSRKFNEMADGFYRSIAYLQSKGKGLRKGLSKEAAEAEAVKVASNVMQNWDALSPIERQVFQRLMPFWGWKRTMMRLFVRYPIDHPYRMAFMRFVAEPYLDQSEQAGLPEEFDNLIPVTGQKGGKQWFFRARGMNPFADFGDLFSVRGFLSALHPGQQALLKFVGVNPAMGGVAAASGQNVVTDPQTGRLRRAYDPSVLVDVVPQVAAVMQAAGLTEGIPKPKDESTAGWMDWLSRYGTKLRLPSVTQRDVVKARGLLARSRAIEARSKQRSGAAGASGTNPW